MIEFIGNIEDFWSNHLASHEYVRQVPFTGMRKDWHDNYNRDYLLQSFNDELPYIWKQFYTVLDVEEGSVAWTCILPNRILPPHYDTFYTLQQQMKVPMEQCVRYSIFLDDYEFGQYVQFDDIAVNTWKKGDIWLFDSSVHHWAANASNVNFHTCQVSTLRKL